MISTGHGDQSRVRENERVVMGEVTQHEDVTSIPCNI